MLRKYYIFWILFFQVSGHLVDFETEGAMAEDLTDIAAWHNGRLLNETLGNLQPGDVFLVPNRTFLVMGGIQAYYLESVTIRIDGTIMFSDNMDDWPRKSDGKVHECIVFNEINNVTFTSTGTGTMDGQGATWWGIPGIGYLLRGENRPILMAIRGGRNLLFEHWLFWNSPYWSFLA